MISSISQRLPEASSVGFSWEMLLVGLASAGSLGCFGTDWGRRGHASLESSRSLFSLRKSTSMGLHPVTCCFVPRPEGCRAFCPWPWGEALCEHRYRGCVLPALSGLQRTRGRYHFVDSQDVHLFHCCSVGVLGWFWFFFK